MPFPSFILETEVSPHVFNDPSIGLTKTLEELDWPGEKFFINHCPVSKVQEYNYLVFMFNGWHHTITHNSCPVTQLALTNNNNRTVASTLTGISVPAKALYRACKVILLSQRDLQVYFARSLVNFKAHVGRFQSSGVNSVEQRLGFPEPLVKPKEPPLKFDSLEAARYYQYLLAIKNHPIMTDTSTPDRKILSVIMNKLYL